MQLYLPIAELPLNIFLLLGVGGAVGFISGMFGVGGGFLLTPLLIFSGIPPAVSVATVTSQIIASSASGALSYWRKKAIDVKLATILFLSGMVGSYAGVEAFTLLQAAGQLDLILSISYVSFLGLIGGLMLTESVRAIIKTRTGAATNLRRPGQHSWFHGLPLKVRLPRSKLYVSILPIIFLGSTIGFLGSMLGIGGGFIMVPALIYLLRVPTSVVIGTSLLQILVTMAMATIMHALNNQSVDMILGLLLMVGGVMGAQFGAQVGQNLRGEHLRLLLGLLVLAVALRFLVNLVITPEELYSLTAFRGL